MLIPLEVWYCTRLWAQLYFAARAAMMPRLRRLALHYLGVSAQVPPGTGTTLARRSGTLPQGLPSEANGGGGRLYSPTLAGCGGRKGPGWAAR